MYNYFKNAGKENFQNFLDFRFFKKNRWNKKFSFWGNKIWLIDEKEEQKDLYVFKLCWTFTYFSLHVYWMCLFLLLLHSWYSYRFANSAVGIETCAITAGIKRYKSIIQKTKTW